MPKKLYFRKLREYDLANDQSNIRLIEMLVDKVTSEAGIRIQFWRDAELYGFDEAISYLAGYCPGSTLGELKDQISRCKELVLK